jgi:hypothetical protein
VASTRETAIFGPHVASTRETFVLVTALILLGLLL